MLEQMDLISELKLWFAKFFNRVSAFLSTRTEMEFNCWLENEAAGSISVVKMSFERVLLHMKS